MQQQLFAVVNGLHGDGEVLKGNGDVFRAKKGRQGATERPLIASKRRLTKSPTKTHIGQQIVKVRLQCVSITLHAAPSPFSAFLLSFNVSW